MARDGRRAARSRRPGTLVVIGGAESKQGPQDILRMLADRTNGGRLVVMTCATEDPEGAWHRYRKVFAELGVRDIAHVDVRDRDVGMREETAEPLDGAKAVFFTGGDQLRITSHLGQTPVLAGVRSVLAGGGIVAGTSAGAAVMSETMLVSGESQATPTIDDIVRMAPGLGFLEGVVVDMHFAERGRLGRLLGAIAQNPSMLGIGIDEDTAIVVEDDELRVVGSGGVYILDGSRARRANVADASPREVLAIEDVTLHLLSAGRRFDLASRRSIEAPEAAKAA